MLQRQRKRLVLVGNSHMYQFLFHWCWRLGESFLGGHTLRNDIQGFWRMNQG